MTTYQIFNALKSGEMKLWVGEIGNNHYDGNFRTPESWSLYYKDAKGEWQEVEGHTAYTVRKDCYNSVDFTPVKTTGLKILAKLQKGESGGVLEWKVNK